MVFSSSSVGGCDGNLEEDGTTSSDPYVDLCFDLSLCLDLDLDLDLGHPTVAHRVAAVRLGFLHP